MTHTDNPESGLTAQPPGHGCGHEVKPGVRFCTVCGRPVADDNRPVVAQPESAYPEAPATEIREPAEWPFGDPASRPQWPELYPPTVDSRAFQPSPMTPAPTQTSPVTPASSEASPVAPASYQPPPIAAAPYWPPPAELGPFQASPAGPPPNQAYPVAPVPPWHPPAEPGPYQVSGGQPMPGGIPPRQPSPRQGQSRRYVGLIVGIGTFLAAGAVAAAAVLVVHPFHIGETAPAASTSASHGASPSSSAPAPAPTPTLTSTSTSPSATPPQEQAARGLSGLLAQSVTDRSSIVAAVSDVNQCGPNLNQDPQTFQTAATSRQNLLAQLADLSGRSALSANMLAALTGAWQNSIQADQDFAQWARDEISNGCTTNDQSDPNAQAAVGPDDQATADKKAFVSLWDPIATQYGLQTYQWNQL